MTEPLQRPDRGLPVVVLILALLAGLAAVVGVWSEAEPVEPYLPPASAWETWWVAMAAGRACMVPLLFLRGRG